MPLPTEQYTPRTLTRWHDGPVLLIDTECAIVAPQTRDLYAMALDEVGADVMLSSMNAPCYTTVYIVCDDEFAEYCSHKYPYLTIIRLTV